MQGHSDCRANKARQLPEAVDVLIVGAGPHGLAMASRMLLGEEALQDCTNTYREVKDIKAHLSTGRNACTRSFAVVDAGGVWMKRWKQQFDVLGIEYLRSNDGMHPDAFASGTLAIWAATNQRLDFRTLTNLPVGFHGHFKAPSTELMLDFCSHLVEIGCLDKHLWQAHVESLEPCQSGVQVKVRTTEGEESVFAKHVVVARGPTWCRRWPAFYTELDAAARGQVHHAWDLIDVPERLQSISGHGVIVGGGLTSAHLCEQLARKGKIDLLIRRGRRVKQYDIDLPWMETLPNGRRVLRQQFEQMPIEQRMATNMSARDGGSITPELNSMLCKLEAEGFVNVHEFTEIASAAWDGCWALTLNTGDVIAADYLICATGTHVDISTDPLLAKLQAVHPLRLAGGLPVLSERLQWGELPIHLMGNHAALELGPDAVNMSGALRGAYRIWPALARRGPKKRQPARRRQA
mmetsp:Transcript_100666/g.307669  ORF Transcript_100666/g.307669 Transcript_100666/m.307669 type:complete len:464 (-) Transcript_100666:437-1828(-)